MGTDWLVEPVGTGGTAASFLLPGGFCSLAIDCFRKSLISSFNDFWSLSVLRGQIKAGKDFNEEIMLEDWNVEVIY